MRNWKKPLRLTIALALIPMLAGCETLRNLIGAAPAEIAPSTFCQAYRPITAGNFDPSAEPGSDAFNRFWDELPAKVGEENDARIRGNNAAFQRNCQ